MSRVVPVILCGGTGERLWPLSRKSYPKQFLNLIGEGSLFQQAVTRVGNETPPLVVTGDDYRFIVSQQLLELGINNAEVIIEPEGKNTGPAILAAASHLASNDPNSVMLVMPSDHYIPDLCTFTDMVEEGVNNLQKGQVICFGVTPNRPETGYGYIRISEDDGVVKPVLDFLEKPVREKAELLIRDRSYLWNAGIFLMRPGDLLEIASKIQPLMLEVVKKAVLNGTKDFDFLRLDAAAWQHIPADSFDYAFMEKIKFIGCLTFNGKWSDLGNWQTVGDLSNADVHGNILKGAVHQIESKDTLLWAGKEDQVLTAIGLDNIMVVSTGDAVLVADRERAQEVKAIVSELRSKGFSQAEQRERDHRPWGWFEAVAQGESFQVKILHVYAGGRLSLQSHKHRSEHWVVVKGEATVVCCEQEFKLVPNESIYIHAGDKHQLRNESLEELEVIEVQTGSYLGEDDIERFVDFYGRI